MKIPEWKNLVKKDLTEKEFEELCRFALNEIKEWHEFIEMAKARIEKK